MSRNVRRRWLVAEAKVVLSDSWYPWEQCHHLYSCDQKVSHGSIYNLPILAKAPYNAYQLVLHVCQARLFPQHFQIHCTFWLASRCVPVLWTLSAREYLRGIAIAEDGQLALARYTNKGIVGEAGLRLTRSSGFH